MTSLQVQYWNVEEQKRHNAEMEKLGWAELQPKITQAEASKTQAQAATSQAESRAREVTVTENLEPYEKWVKGTQSAANIGKTYESLGKGTEAFGRAFGKVITDVAKLIIFG
jgi:hypothetical protein